MSEISFGPESVGYQLTEKALIFGGDTLTATDIAVVTNPGLKLGDRHRVHHLPSELAAAIEEKIQRLCESALDRMKTCPVTFRWYWWEGDIFLSNVP